MRQARKKIAEARLAHDLYFSAVYMNPGSEREVDFYRRLLPTPRLFEWNLPHSTSGTHGCWDIDGVLCRDPTPEENDDGRHYVQYISGVPARIRPSRPLAWIVTSRLEKYRSATEEWLSRNRIGYEHLIMLDLPHREDRLVAGCHASFKASVYKETETNVFVESAFTQAVEIARLAGKCVICFEKQKCVFPGMKAEIIHEGKDICRLFARRFRSKMKRVYRTFMEPHATHVDTRGM
jgi:orotate phosphoribosyltransferase